MVCTISRIIIELISGKEPHFHYLVKHLEQLIRFRRIVSGVTQKTSFCSRKSMHGLVLQEKYTMLLQK